MTALTRTHKATDRDHAGLAAGTASPEEHLPRYFGKAAYTDHRTPRAATKKSGNGRGNWGVEGHSELDDYEYNTAHPRRRSNSSTMAAGHNALKTKFDYNDEMPVFDESLHGPLVEQVEKENELEKQRTVSSNVSSNVSSIDGGERDEQVDKAQ